MTNLYGHKFTSVFGETPHEDWVTVFVGVTGRQIADGLNQCLENYPEWPPGAAQLRALCLGKNPRNTDSEGNDATWQLAHRDAENKKFWEGRQLEEQLRLEDQGRAERTQKLRKETMSAMFASLKQ